MGKTIVKVDEFDGSRYIYPDPDMVKIENGRVTVIKSGEKDSVHLTDFSTTVIIVNDQPKERP